LSRSFDVAVIGGGPAGATAARLLASWGFRVVVAEATPAPRRKPGEILAPAARWILETLELRSALDDPALALRCDGIASDWGGHHLRDFLREPGGRGWIVDRLRFEALIASKSAEAGAEWRWATRLAGVARDPATSRLLISLSVGGVRSTEPISAQFAIDASGRVAVLARRLGARRRVATRRVARECARAAEIDRPGSAWVGVAAHADGWDYAARGPHGRAHGLTFGEGAAAGTEGRGWEAGFSILDRTVGDGWLAAGDAATAFDPLTSQGLPQALSSGLAAAHTVRAILSGDDGAGEIYERVMHMTWLRSLIASKAIYASERRWHGSAFWRVAAELPRRDGLFHSASAPPAAGAGSKKLKRGFGRRFE